MPKFKKIKDYSPEELNAAIDTAVVECKKVNISFYDILCGVDSYFERRKRKEELDDHK